MVGCSLLQGRHRRVSTRSCPPWASALSQQVGCGVRGGMASPSPPPRGARSAGSPDSQLLPQGLVGQRHGQALHTGDGWLSNLGFNIRKLEAKG